MYHIWPSDSQTHLLHSQYRDDTARSVRPVNSDEFPIQLVATIFSGIATMHKCADTVVDQSDADFFKTGDNCASFVGERQGFAKATSKQVLDKIGQIRCCLDLAF